MPKRVNVLLVEDNPADITLTQIGISQFGNIDLHIVGDGKAAMDFLYKQQQFHDVARPNLILLDLSLPKLNGLEVLERIKGDRLLRQIPVIILSSSGQETDIIQAYDTHANAYIVKPLKSGDFSEAIRSLNDFWLKKAILPNGGGA